MNYLQIFRSRRRAQAFTLVELLVVIVVIAVLMALVLPSMVGSMAAMRLTQAGDTLMSTFSLAQQRSVTMGRPVEVRLYKTTTSEDVGAVAGFRSILVFEYYQPGEYDPRRDLEPNRATTVLNAPVAIARQGIQRLPAGVVISENTSLSSFIADLPSMSATGGQVQTVIRTGTTYSDFSGMQGSEEYRSIVFYPENTNLDRDALWFLTVVDDSRRTSAANEVVNFYTVSVDPVTGSASSYRP